MTENDKGGLYYNGQWVAPAWLAVVSILPPPFLFGVFIGTLL